MKRRQCLSGLATVSTASIAGCLGFDVPFSSSPEQPTINDQVRILDHDMLIYSAVDNDGEFIDIIGEAVNTTETTIPAVVIFVELVDSTGQPLTYEFESRTQVPPREIWEFEIPILMPEDGDLASEVDSYSISIHDDARSPETAKDYKYRG